MKGGVAPAKLFARALDLVGAERRAMALLGASLGRGAEADGGLACDQCWPTGGLRPLDRIGDRFRIVAIDPHRHPAGGFEALDLVDRVRERKRSVDGNTVVVE